MYVVLSTNHGDYYLVGRFTRKVGDGDASGLISLLLDLRI